VQLDNLKYELGSVPLALTTTNGNLRSTNEAQMTHINEKGNTKSSLPMCDLHVQVCTILDGMALDHVIGKPAESYKFWGFS
jgi:hypothetical protein